MISTITVHSLPDQKDLTTAHCLSSELLWWLEELCDRKLYLFWNNNFLNLKYTSMQVNGAYHISNNSRNVWEILWTHTLHMQDKIIYLYNLRFLWQILNKIRPTHKFSRVMCGPVQWSVFKLFHFSKMKWQLHKHMVQHRRANSSCLDISVCLHLQDKGGF